MNEPLDINIDFISSKTLNKEDLLQILKISLEDNGYFLENKNSFYKISKISSKQKEELSTVLIELKNIDAQNVLTILDNITKDIHYENPYLKPIITLDNDSNSLILIGVNSEIQRINNIVEALDKQKAQVYIQARIIEVNNELVNKVGVSYGFLKGKASSDGIMAISTKLNGGSKALDDTISLLGWSVSSLNIKSGIALAASLSLLKEEGALDIVSEPSILALNNKESFIYVGEKISMQTSSTITDGGNQRTNYDREDIGLTLRVKPRVSSADKLTLEINALLEGLKIKSVGAGENPDTLKKEINTTAILNNGESVIIGGLIENKSEQFKEKVPVLGDIPLFGELFRSESNISRKNNLVIIVTPYIVPKEKGVSYIRNKLVALKNLEDSYLEESMKNLNIDKKEKETKIIKTKDDKTAQTNKNFEKFFTDLNPQNDGF